MHSRGYGTVLTASSRERPGGLGARAMLALFACSRALVLASGIAGALLVARVAGWTQVDPGHVSEHLGRIGNVLAAAAVRWDSIGYVTIAQHGYTQAQETILFPFYPLLIAAIGSVIPSDVIAGVLISVVSFAIALVLLWRLTVLELGRHAANATVILLMVAPVAFFFTAVYTESLFLVLSVGAIYAARGDRLALAAVLAALATVTRVTGILLVVPIAMMSLERDQPPRRPRSGASRGMVGQRVGVRPRARPRAPRRLDPRLASLALAPAALLAMLAYMHNAGYGWLAPVTNQHGHSFDGVGPLATLAAALYHALTGVWSTVTLAVKPLSPSLAGPFSRQFDSVVLLVVLFVAGCALAGVFRHLPRAYGVYAALALLVSIFSQTRIQPLEGIDRYTLTIFPLWMAAGAWVSEQRLLRPVVAVCVVLLAFYSFEFATWAFIA